MQRGETISPPKKRSTKMSTKEKLVMWALVVAGATIGYAVQDIAGAIVGGVAGLGTLVIGYYADDTLRAHYRNN
jgi:hypothetical protein